jgi:hypothetical protein
MKLKFNKDVEFDEFKVGQGQAIELEGVKRDVMR